MRTVNVDAENPVASFGAFPEDNQNSSSGTVTFELSCSDNGNVEYMQLWSDWTGTWSANQTNSSPVNGALWSVEVMGIPEGSWEWAAWCNDSSGRSDFTATNRSLRVDATSPELSITYPAAATYYNVTSFDFTISEVPDACWYDLNGQGNVTVACQNGTEIAGQEGQNSLEVYANDSSGNIGGDSVEFTLDRTPPGVTINSPGGTLDDVTPAINVSFSESVHTSWYNVDGGQNVTLCTSCSETDENYVNLAEGSYVLHVFANDSTGNVNGTESASLTIDMSRNYYDSFVDNSSMMTAAGVEWQDGNVSFSGLQTGWWNGSWQYRKQLNVTSSAGSALQSGYSVNVSVDTNILAGIGKLLSDCSDLRVVWWNGTGNQELDRVNETDCDSADTQIWFGLEEGIQSGGYDDSYYVYYGNPDAGSPPANRSKVYLFWDDFDDGNDYGWTEYNGNWYVVDGTYYQGADTTSYMRTSAGDSGWGNYTLETRINISSGGSTGGFAGVLFRLQNDTDHYAVILDDRSDPDDSVWLRQWVADGYSSDAQEWTDVTVDRDVWQDLRVDVFDNLDQDTIRIIFDGYVHEHNYSQFSTGRIGLMMHGTQAYYDDIRVRAYVPSEPAVSVLEETLKAAAGSGNFTSAYINTTDDIQRIEDVTWTEQDTDEGNNITVEVSVDGGVIWCDAENGQGVDQGSCAGFSPGSSLVYRVMFSKNSTRTISLLDMNISWTDDAEPPYYAADADDAEGSVDEGESVIASVLWDDESSELGYAVLRTNGSGSWEKASIHMFAGRPEWANMSIDTTGHEGETVCWMQLANDTLGNLNASMAEHCFDVADVTPPYYANEQDDSGGSADEGDDVDVAVYWDDSVSGMGHAVLRTNRTGTYVNESWHAFGGGPGWSNFTIATAGHASESICWQVWANDSSGNWNVSMGAVCFDVIDIRGPFFGNAGDDSTGAVDEGVAVETSAYWDDESSGLGSALLRTNESGSWENSSIHAFGGKPEWANLSIDTSGHAGQSICWVQWANDSLGNLNASMGQECFLVNDITAPYYSDEGDDSAGNVDEGTPVEAHAYWDDAASGLAYALLRTNESGSWDNDSINAFSGKPGWSNFSIDTTGNAGETICWAVWANDSVGNLNSSMGAGCFGVNDITAPYYFDESDDSAGLVPEEMPVNISVYWEDADSSLGYAILRENSTGSIENASVHEFTASAGWSNFSIDTTGNAGETICWAVWANDSVGNPNATMQATHCFDVIDTKAPYYTSEGGGSSGGVDEGEGVGVHAYWDDESSSLGSAVLRTNESGTWENSSIHAFGGKPEWSNFTITTSGHAGETICWAVWANDSIGNLNASMQQGGKCFHVMDIEPPTVTLISPGDLSGTEDGNVAFLYNVTDQTSVVNCSLVFDGGINQTNWSVESQTMGFSLAGLGVDSHDWTVECWDGYSNKGQAPVRRFDVILASVFGGASTDLSAVDDTGNITNFTLEIPASGKIVFSEAVNLSGGADLNVLVSIDDNNITVESGGEPRLNKSAVLSMYGLPYGQTPLIMRDGSPCPPGMCSVYSYSGGNLTFSVSHFTSYSTGANANLAIWDSADEKAGSQKIRTNETAIFYANYTNASTGGPISSAGVYCEVVYNMTDGWSSPENMTYNATSGLYEASTMFSPDGSYAWNVTCDGASAGHETLEASDYIYVYRAIVKAYSGYKVQHGYTTMGTATTDMYVELEEPVSDTSKAFVMRPHYYSCSAENGQTNQADTPDNCHATVYLYNTTHIRLQKYGTTEPIDVDWTLVEALDNEFTAYRGGYNWTASTGLTLQEYIGGTVDDSSTMVLVWSTVDTTDLASFDTPLFRGNAMNSTYIQIDRDVADAGVGGELRWVAVDFDPDKLDSFETGTDTVTTEELPNPLQVSLTTPVDINESMMFFQIGTDSSGLDQVAIAGRLADADTIEFYQDSAGTTGASGATRHIRWYVIDFGSGVGNRYNGTVDYSGTTGVYEFDQTLAPAVDVNRSIVWTSATCDGTGTAFPRSFWNVNITSPSNLRHIRSRTGQENWNEWQLIELPQQEKLPNITAQSGFVGLAVTQFNQSAVFQANCSEVDGLRNIVDAYVVIEENSSGAWSEVQAPGLESNVSHYYIGDIEPGETSENFDFAVQSPTTGEYYVRARCNSSNSEIAYSFPGALLVEDPQAPEWSLYGTNDTTPDTGDSVGFYSYWEDDYNLSSWAFSWNATVDNSWQNVTVQGFSGFSGWSNRTMQIPVFSAGKVIGIRFYANDSWGNVNATNVITLQVQSELDLEYPQISAVVSSPDESGLGTAVRLRANVTDNIAVNANSVKVRVTYPSGSYGLFPMEYVYGDTWEYYFNGTWENGTYDYFVQAEDTSANFNSTEGFEESFSVRPANVSVDVKTVSDEYSPDESVLLYGGESWIDTDWRYRLPLTVTETAGNYIENYTLNLTVDTASLVSQGKMNGSCNDIRFTDSNNDLLGFWVESGCNTSSTLVWVKVPVMEPSSEQTIYMYYGNAGAPSYSSLTDAYEIVGESGTVQASDANSTVVFSSAYAQPPIVFADSMTYADSAQISVRLGATRADGFDVSVEEYPTLDGTHGTETIGWLALKNGTWLIGGLRADVGTGTIDSSYSTVNFAFDFGSTPAIIADLQSYNEGSPSGGTEAGAHPRLTSPTTSGVDMKVEEETDDTHVSETVGYLAIDEGVADSAYTGGEYFETGWDDCAPDLDGPTWLTVTFTTGFGSTPSIVASLMDEAGYADNSNTRMQNAGPAQFDVSIEETPSFTGAHGTEPVGWFASDNGSVIYGRMYLLGSLPDVSKGTEEEVSNYVRNRDSYNVSGYLLMQVRQESTGDIVGTQINDTAGGTMRTVEPVSILGLASIWDGNPWDTGSYPTGYYSVVASLTDPYGTVLKNSTGGNVSGSHTFYLDRDSPEWSGAGANGTTPLPLDSVLFYSLWQDNGELDSWTLQWNVTGSMQGNGSGAFAGNPGWSNASRVVPASMELKTIAWRFVANDTTGLSNTTDTMYLDVGDVTPPVVSGGAAYPASLNVNGTVSLTSSVTDNSGDVSSAWAYVGVPGGGYSNLSMSWLSGNTYNASYKAEGRGRYNATVYANDSSGNHGNGSLFYFSVYGWANASLEEPSGGSYPKTGVVGLSCIVTDANYSTPVEGYKVSFWYEGGKIADNHTDASGHATYAWNTSGVDGGLHTVNCTIGDNQTLYYNDSYGNSYSSITLLVPDVAMESLAHENGYSQSLDEYETGDGIGWVNATLNNTGGSAAGGVNATLSLVGPDGEPAPWFGVKSSYCGTLQTGELCEADFTGSDVPDDADYGSYRWNVSVTWEGGGSPPSVDATQGFMLHHVPQNMSSSLLPAKVLQNESAVYNVTLVNPWSGSLETLNVTMPCYANMTCVCVIEGQEGTEGYCYGGSLGAGSSFTASFNVTTDSDTVPGDYALNVSVGYVNPGGEQASWDGQQESVLSVRGPTKLKVNITQHETKVTRGGGTDLRGMVNNSDTVTKVSPSLNWTLPAGWTNTTGDMNVTSGTLCPSCIMWNNITAAIPSGYKLGPHQVELRSEAYQEEPDWDVATIYIYASTSVGSVSYDTISPYRNGSLKLWARLAYDNSSAVTGQSLSFRLAGKLLGSAVTNGTGYAVLNAVVPWDTPLGAGTLNVSYAGSGTLYTRKSYDDATSLTVQDEVDVWGLSASPQVQGYGGNVTLSADVWSRVAVSSVRANVSYPNGTWAWVEMDHYSGTGYRGLVKGIWDWGDYSWYVYANDSASFGNDTSASPDAFYLRANGSASIKTEKELYGSNQVVYLDSGDEWWDSDWSYRTAINVTESSGNTLTEYQVEIDVNTSAIYGLLRLRPDCGDVRFVWHNETAGSWEQISYWNETPCNISGGNTTFWVQVPQVSGSDKVMYMYSGNEGAQSESSKEDVFSYEIQQPIYYIIHDDDSTVNVSAYYDDTHVTIGSTSVTLNASDVATFSGVSQGDAIMVDKPVAGRGIGNGLDTIIPISWAGKEFTLDGHRGTERWNIYAPFGDASVEVYTDSASSPSQTLTIPEGAVNNYDIAFATAENSIFKSNVSILMYYDGGTQDAIAVYPASTDLWGVTSGNTYITAVYDDTHITRYYSSSTTSGPTTISRTGYTSGGGTSSSQGVGEALHIVADKPVMAIQQADSDGSETSTYLPESELGTEYVLPGDVQYVAVACTKPDTLVTVYSPDGSVQNQSVNCGSNPEPRPNKLLFGTSSTGNPATITMLAGTRFEASEPIFIYYEFEDGSTGGGDESNIIGVKQARKYQYPEPVAVVSSGSTFENAMLDSGETNISGCILMEVRDNLTGSVVSTIVDDATMGELRNIEAGDYISLSELWNQGPWNTTDSQNGYYYAYVALTDPSGKVLENDTGEPLNSTYAFRIEVEGPDMYGISADPQSTGFGQNMTITSEATDSAGVAEVKAFIVYPDSTETSVEMTNVGGYTWQAVFGDTWQAGEYNYSIWSRDEFGDANQTPYDNHFSVAVNASVSLSTYKDTYGGGQSVYITGTLDNTGTTNSSAYLLMFVRDESNGSVIAVQKNDSSSGNKRNLSAGSSIDMGPIWNAVAWDTGSYPTGYYSVVASLTDPYGTVLKNSTGGNVSGSHTFYLDRDSPEWSGAGANGTTPLPLDSVLFYSLWQDNGELDSWTLQWNVTGSMQGNGSGAFAGNPGWSNASRVVPASMELKTIAWRFVANDTTGLSNTTDTMYLDVGDVTPPVVSGGAAYPASLNVNGTVSLTSSVTDNSGDVSSAWAYVGVPGGGYSNLSMSWLSGNTYNASYKAEGRGRYNATVYANDSSGNHGNGSLFYFSVYGWANASLEEPSGGSYPKTGVVGLSCIVTDANYSTPVEGYKVSFWYEGGKIADNHTDASGHATYAWNTSGVDGGLHTVNCTIGDNQTLYYNDSYGNSYSSITLLVPDVAMESLAHENGYSQSLDEYETGDGIGWVNATLNNTGGSAAGGVNATLSLVGPDGEPAPWFGVKSSYCGTLQTGELCEADFTGSDVPDDADYGSYRWNVSVTWEGGGSPPSVDATQGFMLHHVPQNMSSSLLPAKVLQNESAVYNVTLVNPWSGSLETLNVTMPCYANMTCVCVIEGQEGTEGYCYGGSLGAGSSFTASFNVTTDSDTVPGDYALNVSVGYVNPGGEQASWDGQQESVLSVRGPTKLKVNITQHETKVTRGGGTDLRGMVNNSDTVTKVSPSLNWTLPAGWTNTTGDMNVTSGTLCPSCIMWNNITAAIPSGYKLGPHQVELRSEAYQEEPDWDVATIYIYASTSVGSVSYDTISPYRNGSLKLWARLAYDNSSAVTGQSLSFRLAGKLLGSAVTNGTGYAVLNAVVPWDTPLGAGTLNVSYAGSGTLYTRKSYDDATSLTVQDEVDVWGLSASPQVQGYGGNVTLSADVWSRVAVSSVRANVSYPNGTWAWVEMDHYSGTGYRGLVKGIWDWGDYSWYVYANDSASFGNDTSASPDAFYLRANASMELTAEKDFYAPNEYVSVDTNGWWDDSWKYRRVANVTAAGGDLTDYQVNVTIDTSELIEDGKMREDCRDVRVLYRNRSVTEDEFVELPHWIGSSCGSQETEIWVRIPRIEASSAETIYVYYGNQGAQSVENISSTFVFGDDFERADSATEGNGWTDDFGYGSIKGGMLKIQSLTSSDTYWKQLHHAVPAASGDYAVEVSSNLSQTNMNVFGNYFGGVPNRRMTLLMASGGSVLYLNGSSFYSSGKTYASGEWKDYGIWYKQSTGKVTYIVGGDAVAYDANPGISTYMNQIGFGGVSGSVSYWDDVRVRKLATDEPDVTVFGEDSVNSVLRNTGETDIQGYIVMSIVNATTGQEIARPVDDLYTGTMRSVYSDEFFNLSALWGLRPWYTGENVTGVYRVQASLHGPDGTALVDDDGNDINGTYDFHLQRPPAAPSLVEPENASYTADNTTFFNWSQAQDYDGDQVTYYLQVARDQSFSTIVLEKENLTATEYTLADGESLDEDVYYWRVYSYDGSVTNVSAVRQFEVNPNLAVGVALSQNLSLGVNWTVEYFPAYNLSADGNNGTGRTTYYANISASGTMADLYIRAGGHLNTTGGEVIELGNETYTYNVTEPGVPEGQKKALSTDYGLVASGLADGETVHMKFFLTVPATQPPGTYRNDVYLLVVPTGHAP